MLEFLEKLGFFKRPTTVSPTEKSRLDELEELIRFDNENNTKNKK